MDPRKDSGINRRTFLKGVGTATLAGTAGLGSGEDDRTQSPGSSGGVPALRKEYYIRRGERLRAVAMPLGGIGTGSIALAGDGGLRQWQVVHNVNHLAHVPHTFFACWAKPQGAKSVARVLGSSALYHQSGFKPPATSNDHVVPEEARKLLQRLPGVKELEFVGQYPIAEVSYLDPALPAGVRLEAYSPFIPHNAKDSGLPAVIFEFTLKNSGDRALETSLLASLQNFVGWDGQSAISGVEYFAYGGNLNQLSRAANLTALSMSNPHLPADFAFNGTLALATLNEPATTLVEWDDLDALWRDFSEDGALENRAGGERSAEGRTWNGALAVGAKLMPAEEKAVTFLLCWHFPNRYVNWAQPAFTIADRKTKFWIGVQYAAWSKTAAEVAEYVRQNFPRLREETRLWRDTLYNSTLPDELLDSVGSQVSIIRTPTCIWVEDGHLHGFEGCCGASTSHCGNSGCCPLDCTHVWNYEQALARLFPDLERTMRHTDLEVQQAPAGTIPHRTILPFYLPRAWGRKIGGPENPALDGMLGTVLKTYREYRLGGGRKWLEPLWPRVRKLMEYIMSELDPKGEGVIRGEQPTTYDISIYGANTFIGSLYLAALASAAEMARLIGDPASEKQYREVFERGRANLPRECWAGEYYTQKVDLEKHPKFQYGPGCLADQLIGQWWAHQLDLGYILPPEQMREAVRAIFKYNWRENFEGFKQQPRQFASDKDKGLLLCTWPKGGRPANPTLYVDEVWTGLEYEVAALLLYEGMVEEALQVLRGVRERYDGRERSPWNDVECGDHYARAMSSWALLEAASGQRANDVEGLLAFAPRIRPEDFAGAFVTGSAWGRFEQKVQGTSQVNTITTLRGRLSLRKLALARKSRQKPAQVRVILNQQRLNLKWTYEAGTLRFASREPIELVAGDSLRIEVS